jgi:hypothetical protein
LSTTEDVAQVSTMIADAIARKLHKTGDNPKSTSDRFSRTAESCANETNRKVQIGSARNQAATFTKVLNCKWSGSADLNLAEPLYWQYRTKELWLKKNNLCELDFGLDGLGGRAKRQRNDAPTQKQTAGKAKVYVNPEHGNPTKV